MDEDWGIDTREGYLDQSQDREVYNVKDALNTYNMTRSRARDAGPVIQLVDIVAQCEQNVPGAFQRLVAIAMRNDGFRGTSQQTINFFKSLQASYPGFLENAQQVFFDVSRQDAPLVIQNWAVAETLHRFYGLNMTQTYCTIIERFGRYEPDDLESKIALIEYIKWCVTEDVARTLMNPHDKDTELTVDTWASLARSKFGPILPLIVFRVTMALMPFNMTAVSAYRNNTRSMQDILDDPSLKWTIGQGFAAHVMYPNVFTYNRPITQPTMVSAVFIAIDSGATVEQVQQICPYSASPIKVFVMADIMRKALSAGRLDIAISYGLGPNTLNLIDMDQSLAPKKRVKQWPESRYSSWRINDFLDDYEREPRDILETMQLPPDELEIVLQNYYDYSGTAPVVYY